MPGRTQHYDLPLPSAEEFYDVAVVNEVTTKVDQQLKAQADTITATREALDHKMDQIDGKTLSSNDFTDGYKAKLDNLGDKGAPHGLAALDGDGKVPLAQLPDMAFVDAGDAARAPMAATAVGGTAEAIELTVPGWQTPIPSLAGIVFVPAADAKDPTITINGGAPLPVIGKVKEGKPCTVRYEVGAESFFIEGGGGVGVIGIEKKYKVQSGTIAEGDFVKFIDTGALGAITYMGDGAQNFYRSSIYVLIGYVPGEYISTRAIRLNQDGTVTSGVSNMFTQDYYPQSLCALSANQFIFAAMNSGGGWYNSRVQLFSIDPETLTITMQQLNQGAGSGDGYNVSLHNLGEGKAWRRDYSDGNYSHYFIAASGASFTLATWYPPGVAGVSFMLDWCNNSRSISLRYGYAGDLDYYNTQGVPENIATGVLGISGNVLIRVADNLMVCVRRNFPSNDIHTVYFLRPDISSVTLLGSDTFESAGFTSANLGGAYAGNNIVYISNGSNILVKVALDLSTYKITSCQIATASFLSYGLTTSPIDGHVVGQGRDFYLKPEEERYHATKATKKEDIRGVSMSSGSAVNNDFVDIVTLP